MKTLKELNEMRKRLACAIHGHPYSEAEFTAFVSKRYKGAEINYKVILRCRRCKARLF